MRDQKFKIRSKQMLSAARDQSCVNCNAKDGTVVACHYQGLRGDAFGRGVSKKGHDLLVADLCSNCHRMFDNYEYSTSKDRWERKIENSEIFLTCIALTLVRRVQDGVLYTDDIKRGDV